MLFRSCRYLQNSDLEIKRFLEIGCSSGIKTIELSERIGAIGYGIDPSNKAIEEAIQASAVAYQKNFFLPGTADILNFKESFFDLVFFGFCLYLVDRELVVPSFVEADRVLASGKFLAILDFDSEVSYRNTYKHKQGLFSFKQNYINYFINSGYALVAKESYSDAKIGWDIDGDKRVSIVLLQKP